MRIWHSRSKRSVPNFESTWRGSKPRHRPPRRRVSNRNRSLRRHRMSSAAQAARSPETQAISGARLVVEALEREGVTHVFGYPGGAIMPVYDALPGSSLQHILVRHEQAAALAADAYGRVTGRPGVCIATSGPGATNLVTGIANAFLDSVPMVAITGQVATPLMGTDAFQEVDIFGITLPIVN